MSYAPRAMVAISNNWHLIVAVTLAWIIIMLVYGWTMQNDYDDDDSVTFTFQCSMVLANQRDYPGDIVEACNKLRSQ